MKLNFNQLESSRTLMYADILLNAPDIPELDDLEIQFCLFPTFGLAHHSDKYIQLDYPSISEVDEDEQMRRTINRNLFGNRLPDDFEVTLDDVAVCFGVASPISESFYNAQLIQGLKNTADAIVEGTSVSLDKFQQVLSDKTTPLCKHLHIYRDHADLVQSLDGKVYAVKDTNGIILCDLLEEDLFLPEKAGKIDDNARLTDTKHKDFILSQRIEIMYLTRL